MNRICRLPLDYKMLQFLKYCIVGALNTVVCLGVIFVCKSLLGVNPYLSNILGYGAGLINSFLWNKQWVFKTRGGYSREAVRFLVGFAVCYLLQLALVFVLNSSPFGRFEVDIFGFVLSGYGIATLLGNVVYTLANYVYNRLVTFR
ncbi:MAG: GtrA family protein [Muribaculaceae bacterium]